MSVWQKPVNEITYEDVEVFCVQAPLPREGVRLDFKADIPTSLERTLASFANTLGGMIFLGVAGNARNEPIWPPQGLPDSPGISERVQQIANQSVYPPVRVEMSPRLAIPGQPDRVLMVVRIGASPDAPHATDGGRRIYERTGDTNEPYRLAHVDAIDRLLKRRAGWETRREQLIQRGLQRADRRLQNFSQLAMRWVSIIPLFPWRELLSREKCFDLVERWPEITGQSRRMPDGAFLETTATVPLGGDDELRIARWSSVETTGHVFCAEICREAHFEAINTHFARQQASGSKPAPPDPNTLGPRQLYLDMTMMLWRSALESAFRVFDNCAEPPGFVVVTVGVQGCHYVRAKLRAGGFNDPAAPFPDTDYRDELQLAPEDIASREKILDPLTERALFSFGIRPVWKWRDERWVPPGPS